MDRMSLERHGTWATIGGSVLAAGVALALGFPAIAGRVGEQNWWKHPDVIIGMSVSVVGAGIVLAVAADMHIPRQQPLVVEYVQHKTTLQQAEGRFEAYQLANSVGLAWRSAPPEAVCTIGGDASTVTLKVALGDLTCAYPTDFPGVEPTTGSLSVSWLARRREVSKVYLWCQESGFGRSSPATAAGHRKTSRITPACKAQYVASARVSQRRRAARGRRGNACPQASRLHGAGAVERLRRLGALRARGLGGMRGTEGEATLEGEAAPYKARAEAACRRGTLARTSRERRAHVAPDASER